MADEKDKDEKREDSAKMLAETMNKVADSISDAMKRMDKMDEDRKADRERMDAMFKRKDEAEDEKKADKRKDEAEEEKAEPKEVAADKKRKDEAEDEKKADKRKDEEDCTKKDEDEKRDDKYADALNDAQKRIADVEKLLAATTRAQAPEDKAKFADAQSKADRVYRAFGDSAPPPMAGETHADYERRLLTPLKKHSKVLAEVNLHAIHDDTAFSAIQGQIFADAEVEANSPARVPAGQLRARERSEGGHTIITYDGDSSSWMNQFSGPQRQAVTAFKTGA